MYSRDSDGRIVPHNDPDLKDDDTLVRRVTSHHIVPVGDGRRRISKSAMSASSQEIDPYRGMSVDSLQLLKQIGIDPSSTIYHPEAEVILGLCVGDVRKACPDLKLGRCPIEGVNPNPAHCAVWGLQKESDRKKLLAISSIVRGPTDVSK